MYNTIVAALKEIKDLAVAEYEWKTRPTGDHATIQLDFGAEGDTGNDHHQDQAYEGSVDLYTHGQAWLTAAAVETVLETYCGGAWDIQSIQYERETGLVHREYVFQIEVL